MTEKQLNRAKQEFIDGHRDSLRLGGYGGTVTVKAAEESVLIQTTKPRRRQKKIGVNSRSIRRTGVQTAEIMIERLQQKGRSRIPKVPARRRRQAGIVTPRDVFLEYLRLRLGPQMPEGEVLTWGRKDVDAFLLRLNRASRRRAKSPAHIYSMIQAARRLHRDGLAPLDSDVEAIQAGDLDEWVNNQLAAGASEHTVKTYSSRFRTAIRTYAKKWGHRWGDRVDPTEGMTKISTEHIRPPEVGEERVAPLVQAMRKLGLWRVLATAVIADATARRVGAISGGRDNLHLDAPPLRQCDFEKAADGLLEVTWRAPAQKGDAYGRGDVVHPTTRQLNTMYRWLRRFHPNPAGPEHPLIWAEDDPTQAETYDRLLKGLGEAWLMAFGEPKPHGLGWHAFCRTTITTVAEEAGVLAASNFSGRSVKVVEGTYRRVRRQSLRATAERLDDVRAQPRWRGSEPADGEAQDG